MNIEYTLADLEQVASSFIRQIGERKRFAFYGEMGAGKTTLIAEICRQLGVEEPVNSPTFAIVNEYETPNSETIYHFDCYRLKSAEEGLNIGAEEYFESGSLCFIEWSERIEEILPDETVEVRISVVGDNRRVLDMN